jgi:antitoxin (DNA-binding transcriptional repressor) of toxin-antitoxin stability system
MQFTDFSHYCSERLGMSGAAVSQRASLERRLHELPALRAALRDGRVGYEKARIVAAHADGQTLDGWIERAERLPCIALAREAEAGEEVRMCARGEAAFRLPARVVSLLDEAIRTARAAAGRFITPAEALERIAEHFIATWGPALRERNTLQRRVLDRDRRWCQVPGCSRAALHVHHLRYRSHGGPDSAANLVSLCAAHHLHGVHAGHLRVAGAAPHRLRWSFAAGGGPASGPASGASGPAGEQSAAG